MKTIKKLSAIAMTLALIFALSFSSNAECKVDPTGNGECQIKTENVGGVLVISMTCQDTHPFLDYSKCKKKTKPGITSL